MDIIIPNLPRYSDGEVNRAFMREIQTGYQREVALEKKRTLGKCVATIPARDFFRLTKKYGHETVHSKEFIKYYNKKFPELSANKA